MDEQTTQQPQPEAPPRPEQQTQDPVKADIENNKAMGILAYILFFIPLLAAKDSKFARYHANQGLVLFLVFVCAHIVFGMIPFLGWILGKLASLACLVFMVLGIINAAQGETKPLPVIGGITLLK